LAWARPWSLRGRVLRVRSNMWQCHGGYVLLGTILFRMPLERIAEARSRLFYYRTYFINKPCPFVG
jgi:hypothetical protein